MNEEDIENLSDKEARKAWFHITFETMIMPVMRAFWKSKYK